SIIRASKAFSACGGPRRRTPKSACGWRISRAPSPGDSPGTASPRNRGASPPLSSRESPRDLPHHQLALQAPQAVHEELAVEMIRLVAESAREEVVPLDRPDRAGGVGRFHRDAQRACERLRHPGNREAPFV